MMQWPLDHPQRRALNDEVHARPPEVFDGPVAVSYIAVLTDWSLRERVWEHLDALAQRYGIAGPAAGATHCSIDCGEFRLRWEQHTEFARFMFVVAGASGGFDSPAVCAVPADWVAAMPGQLIVAAHAAIVRSPEFDPDDAAAVHFAGNGLIGAAIGSGAAFALTDFRVHADRFGRWLVHDRSMTPRQAGRMLQRLLEIDTYRVMALLALPLARELAPQLDRCERELTQITAGLGHANAHDEPVLLDRLTALQAQIQSLESNHHYRFSAAAAYHQLVRQRIIELRETRIEGLPTFQEFTERRLAPAMSTCQAVATRQASLSQRLAQATQLLSTRVDLTREQQNQALLESMNRRVMVQLRLQQAVEGLSVAAISYYVVGLVGFVAKGLVAGGAPVDAEMAMAASVPIVVVLVAWAIHKARSRIARSNTEFPR